MTWKKKGKTPLIKWIFPFFHVCLPLRIRWRLHTAGIIPLSWCGSDYVRVEHLCGCCDLVHCQHRAASVVLLWLSAGFRNFSFYNLCHMWSSVYPPNLAHGAGKLLTQGLRPELLCFEYVRAGVQCLYCHVNLTNANNFFPFICGYTFMEEENEE